MKKWLIFWMLWCCIDIGITLSGCCIRGQVLWLIDTHSLLINYVSLMVFIMLYRDEERRDAKEV